MRRSARRPIGEEVCLEAPLAMNGALLETKAAWGRWVQDATVSDVPTFGGAGRPRRSTPGAPRSTASRSRCSAGPSLVVPPGDPPVGSFQEQWDARMVLDIGRMCSGRQHQADGFNQEVTLAANDLLPAIKPADVADAGGANALAVDECGARLRMAPDANTDAHP